MSVINTNVKATIAQNALSVNNRKMGEAMQQLSTGKRISSAKDDAAGLAIASKMTAQIRGLNQAVRNANDGISLVQTAEGALVEVTNMLQRMRELAVQSANDTNTSDDRTALDDEFQQLKAEINRVGNNTQFNGTNLLDKSFGSGSGSFTFQVGANASQTISLTIGDFRTAAGTSTNGTVTLAYTQGGSPTASQVTTVTLGGTYGAGDVIGLNVGGKSILYEVTASAVASGIGAIGSAVVAALGTVTGVTITESGGALTLTSASGVAFEVSAAEGGLLANVDGAAIRTKAGSNASVTALDLAIKTVNEKRSEMGATINRLNYAADNLTNVSANAQESRSRIEDADYAKATTELARTSIIQQAATAMLAQANQQPQAVLSLLQ